jgi:hypothetical protein
LWVRTRATWMPLSADNAAARAQNLAQVARLSVRRST